MQAPRPSSPRRASPPAGKKAGGFGTTYLADVCQGRDNNFNLIRIVLATSVLISHAYGITGGFGTPEPLEASTGFRMGTLAVFGFFALSGFLIARSFDRAPGVSDWAAARIARLYPGLILVVLLAAFVLGPAVTTIPLGDYLKDTGVYSYVVRHLLMLDPYGKLPGVFEELPVSGYVNGPLWTLMYEVICYLGVLVLGLAGLLRNRAGAALFFAVQFALITYAIAIGFASVDSEYILGRLAYLSAPFAIGTIFYLWRESVPLGYVQLAVCVVLTMLARVHAPGAVYSLMLLFTLSYGIFVLAYLPGGWIRKYNKLGDYSYGVYIFAWPVQQLVVLLLVSYSPYVNMAVALPVTFALAIVSWHFLEKPSLARRHLLAAALRNPRLVLGW